MDVNHIVLIGRLVRDPELRFTADGVPVVNMRIAVNRMPAPDGTQNADFFDVAAWRRLAEICAEYVQKGQRVAIEGRLRQRTWKTAEGENRSKIEVEATNVQFLERAEAGATTQTDTAQTEEIPADILDDAPPF